GDTDEALRIFTNMVRGPGTWEGMPNAARAARRDNVHTLKPTLTNPAERFTCDDARKINSPTLLVGGDVSPRIFLLMLNGLQPALRHRQRQARYEAHLRDGIGLFPTPLRTSVTAVPDGTIRFSTNHSKNGKKMGRRTADCLTGFRW